MNINFVYPWKMVGRYEDDYEAEVGGSNEEDCMGKLIDLQEKHGNLVWYSGLCDEDYEAGEYIGRENFIYD
jgi:hypothetical protein